MALTKDEKSKIIKDSQRNEKDTGSTEVQIAILDKKIEKLTKHMIDNPHDYSSKRGMNICIAHRKKLLNYLKNENFEKYNEVINNKKKTKKAAK